MKMANNLGFHRSAFEQISDHRVLKKSYCPESYFVVKEI
jgi:hypothetical protein